MSTTMAMAAQLSPNSGFVRCQSHYSRSFPSCPPYLAAKCSCFSSSSTALNPNLSLRNSKFLSRPSIRPLPARKGIIARLGSQGRRRIRLAEVIASVPERLKAYFELPFRRPLFGGIALFGGFYVAQTISLSFGALGVNDVVAAALCVLFTEYITRFYHTRAKPTFSIALLNVFKMGFTYGLFIDAFKLAS